MQERVGPGAAESARAVMMGRIAFLANVRPVYEVNFVFTLVVRWVVVFSCFFYLPLL